MMRGQRPGSVVSSQAQSFVIAAQSKSTTMILINQTSNSPKIFPMWH